MTDSAVSQLRARSSAVARLAAAARREYALFLVGTGAIAVHLLDDSFLQPESGTSARDHLVSGLVPLSALLVASWAYPRLRPGPRATLALALGLFGLVAGGAEGGYHLVTTGASADDYTGLLAVFGGMPLLALGVVELWRMRRLDESRGRRYLRRSLVGIAAAVVFFEIAFPILFAYGYTHFGRSFVPQAHLGVGYENVTFRTSDGLKLAGWYVPSKNRAAVRRPADKEEAVAVPPDDDSPATGTAVPGQAALVCPGASSPFPPGSIPAFVRTSC
jgi:hypothetical protein